MKTFFSILIIGLSIINVQAQEEQDSATHMTFKGIPIDGTLNEYVIKLKNSGFNHIGTEDGFAVLEGDFAGYKNCMIGVSTLDGKDLVSHISIVFTEKDTWSSLSNNYFTLKELLTTKYGEPTEVVEEFDTSPQPKDDFYKRYAVTMNNCYFSSAFTTENGMLILSIESNGVMSTFVKLTYYDKINTIIVREKALDDL